MFYSEYTDDLYSIPVYRSSLNFFRTFMLKSALLRMYLL